ncbi:hypothetical protein BUALT_Bualt04G0015400 [Buddleja alternifolia]|uniref:Cytochrome P450 n=1 Tax=Buddleja alternifolia TaxID=168488 RepID=A0AAV6XKI1_9LAMI|nr:hypothetical protein BUALT_Bualt04G0015400 [Buddleja alternifolia]
MYLRFGSVPTIVVSSPGAAELFLKTHDLIFANRPHHEASSYLGYEQRNIVFGKYGPYWRNMRKLSTVELLSNLKISQFQPMRRAELGLLVSSLKQAAEKREIVDMSLRIMSLSADMTCLMVFGKKYGDRDLDEKGFKEVMKETMEEAAAFNLGDYFPYLRRLDLQGSARRLKILSKIFDGFLERIIDEHVQNKQEKGQSQDFVDTMMGIMESGEAGFQFDRRHVKAVLLDQHMLRKGYLEAIKNGEKTIDVDVNQPDKIRAKGKKVLILDQRGKKMHTLPKVKSIEELLPFEPVLCDPNKIARVGSELDLKLLSCLTRLLR